MKKILLVVGGLAVVLGGWWILQGTGAAPVGAMANQRPWAYRGAGLVVIGVILVLLSRRR
jgi:hypothetical protein